MQLFRVAADSEITMPPGVLSKFTQLSDKEELIKILKKFKNTIGEFAEQDIICQQLLNIDERDEIESREQLHEYFQSNSLSEKGITTLKNSLKNEEVGKEILDFFKNQVYKNNDLMISTKKYLKHRPYEQSAEYIAPLIVKEILEPAQLIRSDEDPGQKSSSTRNTV